MNSGSKTILATNRIASTPPCNEKSKQCTRWNTEREEEDNAV
jgi:hypothetical protein